MSYFEFDEIDWRFEDAPPTPILGDEPEALIAEADLSAMGLFRLETRPAPGGFAIVIRHAEMHDERVLAALGDAAAAEAERYGVRVRVRSEYDPTLRPTS